MSIATPDDVRSVTGLTADEADDSKLENYITKAYRRFVNDVCLYAVDDLVTGTIDGTNTTFSLNYTPLADSNFDGVANSLDVEVYSWGTYGDISTMSTVPLSTINSKYGIMVFQSAPADTIEAVTASYYYYPRNIPDQLIVDGISYLAGYLYVMQEFLLIPERLSHGAYRISYNKPYQPLWDEYQKIKMQIVANLAYKGENDEPDNSRVPISEEE